MIKFFKTRDVKSPRRAHNTDAGVDFFVPNDCEPIVVEPNKSVLISTGIHVKIPNCTALIAFNKSGIAAKKSLILGACVIDSSYQDEILINLHNIGTETQTIEPGTKITQFVHIPVILSQPEEMKGKEEMYGNSYNRQGGFGSTGIKD